MASKRAARARDINWVSSPECRRCIQAESLMNREKSCLCSVFDQPLIVWMAATLLITALFIIIAIKLYELWYKTSQDCKRTFLRLNCHSFFSLFSLKQEHSEWHLKNNQASQASLCFRRITSYSIQLKCELRIYLMWPWPGMMAWSRVGRGDS